MKLVLKNKITILLFLGALVLTSCNSTQKIVYFQDEVIGQQQALAQAKPIVVQPSDQIFILVSCSDPKVAAPFNLARVSSMVGNQNESYQDAQGQIAAYTIDADGNIDFPMLGQLHVAGLTRNEIAKKVKAELIGKSLVKDPVVTVSFQNLQYSVLGEVNKPGQFNITKDKTTLLDAISMAGDLTIYGQRDKVYLTRTENNQRITYKVDLRSKDIYTSPAFYLQQNDMIYVEPNKVKASSSTVNGNNVKSISLWLSIASFLTTLGLIFRK